MLIKPLVCADFDFDLPPELIAQKPLPQRTASRLLCLTGCRVVHRRFADLGTCLHPGDLLVLNDTRVIPARSYALKDSGGQAELLLERIESSHIALFQVRVSKPLKAGRTLMLLNAERSPTGCLVRVQGRSSDLYRLRFPQPVLESLEAYGQVPLPPYIQRAPGADDRSRYQTVFAKHPGAVAAPTAGLHFDAVLLQRLQSLGIESSYITLHVGAGTFQPIRSEDLATHQLHHERVSVTAETVDKIRQTRQRGGRIVAVGTTVIRALESAALAAGGKLAPFEGETELFILPGFQFQVADSLITNFHLPRSTLLMLVSAFCGREQILKAYREAVMQRYRFFSYGDAMLLQRSGSTIE